MLSDLLMQAVMAAVMVFGLWLLYLGLEKWRVLLASIFWPRTAAHLHDKHVDVVEVKSVHQGGAINRTRNMSVQQGAFYTTIIKKEYVPVIELRYRVGSKDYKTANSAHYNQRLFRINKDVAQALIDRYTFDSIITVPYNPKRPEEIFLGAAHFPFIRACIQSLAGLAISMGGVAITAEFLLGLFGIPEPLINGRSAFIYLVMLLACAYLLLSSITAWLGSNRHDHLD
jgi:hypothetical protein